MEWNNKTRKFERKSPKPPPIINVKVSLMNEVHKDFGIHCTQKPDKDIEAIADTGCQTTTCGIDTLREMNIPEQCLIPTNHGIVGITDTRLNILGTLMLKMTYNGSETRQMVYVSSNPMGLYLSEKHFLI